MSLTGLLLLLITTACYSFQEAVSSDFYPVNLKRESRENPIGIDIGVDIK